MLNHKRTAILSVRIPKELKALVATNALKERVTLSDKVNEILIDYIEGKK